MLRVDAARLPVCVGVCVCEDALPDVMWRREMRTRNISFDMGMTSHIATPIRSREYGKCGSASRERNSSPRERNIRIRMTSPALRQSHRANTDHEGDPDDITSHRVRCANHITRIRITRIRMTSHRLRCAPFRCANQIARIALREFCVSPISYFRDRTRSPVLVRVPYPTVPYSYGYEYEYSHMTSFLLSLAPRRAAPSPPRSANQITRIALREFCVRHVSQTASYSLAKPPHDCDYSIPISDRNVGWVAGLSAEITYS